jgi:hypothetical protein
VRGADLICPGGAHGLPNCLLVRPASPWPSERATVYAVIATLLARRPLPRVVSGSSGSAREHRAG